MKSYVSSPTIVSLIQNFVSIKGLNLTSISSVKLALSGCGFQGKFLMCFPVDDGSYKFVTIPL